MELNQYNDDELKKLIINKLKENGVKDICESGYTGEEIASSFMKYTPEQRKIIVNWYSFGEKTEQKMNFIKKNGFESKHFYISAREAVVGMMLNGHKVNGDRKANVTKNSMEKIDCG